MSTSTHTPCRTVRHRRRSKVTASALTAQPLTHDAITFRDVEDTESKQVVGKEVVYVPLAVDTNLSVASDFDRFPNDGSTRSYSAMMIHAMSMLRCRVGSDLYYYLCEGGNAGRFDQKI